MCLGPTATAKKVEISPHLISCSLKSSPICRQPICSSDDYEPGTGARVGAGPATVARLGKALWWHCVNRFISTEGENMRKE